MDAGNRVGLLAEFRLGNETVIEEDEHHGYVVFLGDLQEAFHTADQSLRISLIDDVLHENAGAVQTAPLGPAQFLVDGPGIESLPLPHLGRVDRGARNVVETANRPDAFVPLPSLLGRPTRVAELLQGAASIRWDRQRQFLLGIEHQPQVDVLPADRLVDMNRQRVLPGVG